MSKIYGLFGAMTGKVADVVMVVRNGEQIVRKYQPVVSNPSTPAQVANRARLKLMSQLGSVVGKGLGFRRSGLVSARNLFVQQNYPLSSYSNGAASIPMLSVELTGGHSNLPAVITPPRADFELKFSLETAPSAIDGVVYVIIEKGSDNRFSYAARVEVTEAGENGHYGGTLATVSSRVGGYIYAYGYRFTSDRARARYKSLLSSGNNGVLDVVLSMNENEVEFTHTSAVEFTAVN